MAIPHVPVIDVSRPLDGQLDALDTACRDHGFFLITGHGFDDVVARTWAAARSFFEAGRAVRLAVERDGDNPLGWYDRELTKRRRDAKEVFDFTDPASTVADGFNRWPNGLAGFRSTMTEFYDAFSELSTTAVEIVHRGLGLDPGDGLRFGGARSNSSVRLNHYPVGDPVPEEERVGLRDLGESALGYHTDPGVVTLLLQDDTGGLQTRSRDGEWIDVDPVPGTVVVNLADSVQVWTNDRYRAAVHRVVPMTETARMSIPYFLHPARDAVIEPIDELVEGAALYRSFEWRAFMRARTDDNFADLGAADTQIGDYLVAASSGSNASEA
ncbi:isopenicillin N synthase family dioxygenase [Ilumatobacter sp.]|uniref:isopenicillin N synthase family dioxygenase n=1 Tax=Ilumatobacter sp. TaxID=1967498 RepID=UPI003C45222C